MASQAQAAPVPERGAAARTSAGRSSSDAEQAAIALLRDPGALIETMLAGGPGTTPVLRQLDRDIGLSDVQQTLEDFFVQDNALEEAGLEPLIVERRRGPIPVLFSIPADDDVAYVHQQLLRASNYGTAPRPRVFQNMFSGLREFLLARSSGSRLLHPEEDETRGLGGSATLVKVRCRESDLHVFYSMAFILRDHRARLVFGNRQTSPVAHHLPDGIWAFATARGRGPASWEEQEIAVPDVTAIDLDGPL